MLVETLHFKAPHIVHGHVHLVEFLLQVDGITQTLGATCKASLSGHSAVVDLLLGVINIDPNV
jgi:hypothetical protein